MDFLTTALGATGSLISFVLWVPQARQVWAVRTDEHALRGISLTTQVLVLLNAAVWFAYAAVLGAFWVGAAGFVNMPLAIAVITLVLRARARARAVRADATR